MIKIQDRKISVEDKPFIIAEMSGNHNQSLDRALEIVDSAAAAGADALKVQTYTADTMTLNLNENEFKISDKNSLWYGESLYHLYEKAQLPWEWHKDIFDRCKKRGIIGFSAPFDSTAVDFLNDLDVPLFKIASFENTDLPLIKKVAATGKPMIISTGLASLEELSETVQVARDAGCKDLILLKCTSSYPASPENTHIRTIPHMRETFDCEVGLSDHTFGIGVAVASVALGASVIEKHFTLSRADGGVDSAFSLEPSEMKSLVIETERAHQGLGQIYFGPTKKEEASLVFRRSLYITKGIKKGQPLDENNMRAIRPGLGLSPKYYDELRGRQVNRDVSIGTPITWDLIE